MKILKPSSCQCSQLNLVPTLIRVAKQTLIILQALYCSKNFLTVNLPMSSQWFKLISMGFFIECMWDQNFMYSTLICLMNQWTSSLRSGKNIYQWLVRKCLDIFGRNLSSRQVFLDFFNQLLSWTTYKLLNFIWRFASRLSNTPSAVVIKIRSRNSNSMGVEP